MAITPNPQILAYGNWPFRSITRTALNVTEKNRIGMGLRGAIRKRYDDINSLVTVPSPDGKDYRCETQLKGACLHVPPPNQEQDGVNGKDGLAMTPRFAKYYLPRFFVDYGH